MTIETIIEYLQNYDGPDVRIMEVCGSHTAAIAKNGIAGLVSPKIHLISGPGCPVCVTPSSYVDRLIELAKSPNTCVVTFGDLLRVPGSRESLGMAKSGGARCRMVYSPDEIVRMARENPATTYIFAAVGFETTTPVYALLVERLIKEHIENVKLLTALRMMPPVLEALLGENAPIDGFLAPGHVAAVTGADAFIPVAEKYGVPFAVSGFSAKEILISLYDLVKKLELLRTLEESDGRELQTYRAEKDTGEVKFYKNEHIDRRRNMSAPPLVDNCYPSVVTAEGNRKAQELIDRYFETGDAVWRGMGTVIASGRYLREEYARFDAGSRGLDRDEKLNPACRCDQVLTGRKAPNECPLYGKVCTPMTPQGACMVSAEGSCSTWYRSGIR